MFQPYSVVLLLQMKLQLKMRFPLGLLIFYYSKLALISADSTAKKLNSDQLHMETVVMPQLCANFAQIGDILTVHYNGTFGNDSSLFDSSYKRGHPLNFQLGFGEVISGWDKGLVGMCRGEIRRLIVPPHMGYGEKGAGGIPGNMTLIFLIQLLEIKQGSKPPNVFKQVDTDANGKLTRDEVATFMRKQIDQINGTMNDLEVIRMIKDVFNREDLNQDGFITLEEFTGPKHDSDL